MKSLEKREEYLKELNKEKNHAEHMKELEKQRVLEEKKQHKELKRKNLYCCKTI